MIGHDELTHLRDYRLFLDLDGVVADFLGGIERAYGLPIDHHRLRGGEYDVASLFHTTNTVIGRLIRSTPDFWANLPVLPHTPEIVALFPLFKTVHILTKPWNQAACFTEKVRWARRWLGVRPHQVIITPDKWLLAAPDRLLVDDNLETVQQWQEFGGQAVLFPTVQNMRSSDFPVMHTLLSRLQRIPPFPSYALRAR